MNCKHCGKEFTPNRPWQEYCSPDCRRATGRAKQYVKKVFEPIPCAYCGKMFTPKSSINRFCSAECKQKMPREKVEEYYTLVKDPLPFSQGGFRKGATFSKTEIDHMLPKRVIFAGTVLEKKGQLFEIRANGRGKLRLEKGI